MNWPAEALASHNFAIPGERQNESLRSLLLRHRRRHPASVRVVAILRHRFLSMSIEIVWVRIIDLSYQTPLPSFSFALA